ncbi:hypothetical protein Plhal710r2_c030g0113141 [Plasmopara halstedii]
MASCTSLLLRDDLVSPILPIFTLEKTFERTTHAFQAVEFPRHQYLRMPILKMSLSVCLCPLPRAALYNGDRDSDALSFCLLNR